MSPAAPRPTHFASAADFRAWLLTHHAASAELWVGFYKKSSGRPGLTYTEAVDEALCFGWIDGIVKKTGPESFTHRFTPRRPGSIWSNINVRHVARLTAAGKMHRAGLAAFEAREHAKTGIYAYEQPDRPAGSDAFPAEFETIFRAKSRAWKFWSAQPPGWRRTIVRWVTGAKQDATRLRRLDATIAASAAGHRVGAAK